MVTQAMANDAAMDIFPELDAKSIALLLDVDGTLIDIGPSPGDVHVSDELRERWRACRALTGGALALVSGRPIADLDRAVRAAQTAGDRRPRRRDAPARAARPTRPAAPLPHGPAPATRRRGDAGLRHHRRGQGLFAGAAFPQAPQQEERLRCMIAAGRAAFPGEATEVLPGKSMFEVKRPGRQQGRRRCAQLMQHPPFAGRMPVFIGDDVTDESVFAVLAGAWAAWDFRSAGILPALAGIFDSPLDVRRALQRLAARGQQCPA